MVYDKKIILLILQLVRSSGNIHSIISTKLSFQLIYKYLTHLKRNGLITDIYGELKLTDLGEKEIVYINKELKRKYTEQWISPQYEYIIEKQDKFKVYLP